MSANKPASSPEHRGAISRRRVLQMVPGLAALAAAGATSPTFALAAPSTEATPASTTPGAPALLTSSNVGIPFRSIEDACGGCVKRRSTEGSRIDANSSPLEKILAATSLAESRLGLGNWPLLDETEDVNLGHFTFPISPFNPTADDGSQEFLLVSNNHVIANFRVGDYLEDIQRRIYDRAVWAMREGRVGTAVVEFDRPVLPQKVDRIVRLLGYVGIRSIVWGNEPNDPYTPWRDNLQALFDVLCSAAEAKKKYGLNGLHLSMPGLAYYGNGEYLQKMVRTLRDLQRKRYPASSDDLLVQRVADHYYGPVDGLLKRIKTMRGIMAGEGVTQLKYDLTELGNPSLDPNVPKTSDQQLAEGYIPQVASIAIGSGQVDTIDYYSLLDISPDHSTMGIENGHLAKRPQYQAFIVTAKLLARLTTLNVVEERDLVRVDGRRSDGIAFQILWSKVPDRVVWVDLPSNMRVYNALGQEVKEDRPGQLALYRKEHPYLGGPARITVAR